MKIGDVVIGDYYAYAYYGGRKPKIKARVLDIMVREARVYDQVRRRRYVRITYEQGNDWVTEEVEAKELEPWEPYEAAEETRASAELECERMYVEVSTALRQLGFNVNRHYEDKAFRLNTLALRDSTVRVTLSCDDLESIQRLVEVLQAAALAQGHEVR